jgi:isopenicillin N synthase-like dioxygenase
MLPTIDRAGQKYSNELFHAFHQIGFGFLKNSSLNPTMVQSILHKAKLFFDCQQDLKLKASSPTGTFG